MTDNDTTIREAQEALARLDKAAEEIGEVAANVRSRWRMSIPANPNRDTDLIVSDACVTGQRAITALLAVIEQQAETLRQVRELAEDMKGCPDKYGYGKLATISGWDAAMDQVMIRLDFPDGASRILDAGGEGYLRVRIESSMRGDA